jgi:hypothetical protein
VTHHMTYEACVGVAELQGVLIYHRHDRLDSARKFTGERSLGTGGWNFQYASTHFEEPERWRIPTTARDLELCQKSPGCEMS